MKGILITGSSGFVGRNLIQYSFNSFVNLYKYDRVKGHDLKNIDIVIHLAGKAHDTKNVSDSSVYYESNFELTKKVYDVFLKSDTSKFIFISSVKSVKDSVSQILFEDQEPEPKTHYGKSKLLAEQYIQSFELPANKRYYILRPSMIHGPGNKGNLNLLYKLVSKGIPWPLASFENKRSFLSIENLCFVIKELIERDDIPSGVYNIADDDAISTNELVQIISNSLKRKTKLLYLNTKFIKYIAKFGDIFHLPLNSERLNKLTESYVVSNNKIVNALGKPLPVKAVDGLKFTIDSFNIK